jgi:hypothetical protein
VVLNGGFLAGNSHSLDIVPLSRDKHPVAQRAAVQPLENRGAELQPKPLGKATDNAQR